MIIDCHTHIGRNNHIDYSVKQLLSSMDIAGIDKSLVFACDFNDCPNEFLLREIKNHRDRLHPVLAYHPGLIDHSVYDKIGYLLATEEVAAVKMYLGYDHWYPNDKHIYRLLELTSEMDIPVIFHCGDCLSSVKSAKLKYAHPLGVDEVAVDFPNQKIVIAHMGYPWHRDTAEVCYKNENVYADISGFVYGDFSQKDEEQFGKVLREFLDIAGGDSKLLFGSDAPISSQLSYLKVTKWQEILSHLSHDIFEKNPKKVFNL